MQVFCTGERHASGGPGEFYLARAEEALPSLLERYRDRVQVVYLDIIAPKLIQFNVSKSCCA